MYAGYDSLLHVAQILVVWWPHASSYVGECVEKHLTLALNVRLCIGWKPKHLETTSCAHQARAILKMHETIFEYRAQIDTG